MAKVGRNAPCPCGSGKKYKHCHLRADEDAAFAEAVSARPAPTGDAEPPRRPTGPAAPPPAWMRYVPWAIGVTGLAGAAALFQTTSVQAGATAVVATLLVVAGWNIFNDPPPPKDDTRDPAGIDFGR